MHDYDVYLTKKAHDRPWVKAVETVLLALLSLLLFVFVWATVELLGSDAEGMQVGLVLIAAAAGGIWVILQRRKDRPMAQKIAAALAMARNERVPYAQLAEVTGIANAAQVIALLDRRGYLAQVAVQPDGVLLTGKPGPQRTKCPMCGASLVQGDDGVYRCTYCGTTPAEEAN